MDEILSDSSSKYKHVQGLSPQLSKEIHLDIEDSSEKIGLLEEAEFLLSQKNTAKAQEILAELMKIQVTDPVKIIEQSSILSRVGTNFSNTYFLLNSNKKLRLLLKQEDKAHLALELYATNLMTLYQLQKQVHYLWDAQKAFEMLLHHVEEKNTQSRDIPHWQIARCYMHLAPITKEPLELCKALYHFEKAAKASSADCCDFYREWACCCLSHFDATADTKFCLQGVQLLKVALKKAKTKAESPWQDMAKALYRLYIASFDATYFLQAKECYELALQRHPQKISYLLECAEMALEVAKQTKDPSAARIALDKSRAILAFDCNMLKATCIAATALSLIGEMAMRLDQLNEAHEMLLEIDELFPHVPTIQSSLGLCLMSLSRYYQDVEYCYLAIEKFQAALSLDRLLHSDWYNMGQSFFFIAEQLQDLASYERALYFFDKALALYPRNTHYLFQKAVTVSRIGENLQSPEHLWLAVENFELLHQLQKNILYVRPTSFFEYARVLDLYADFHEEEKYYTRAIDALMQISLVHPHFPGLYHQLGVSFSHLADLTGVIDSFYKALHYLKIASKTSEENGPILVDMGITLINIAMLTADSEQQSLTFIEAYEMLTKAAMLGEVLAYYQLACLFSLKNNHKCSFAMLHKAKQYHALPSVEELNADEWLDSLRETEEWNLFILNLE